MGMQHRTAAPQIIANTILGGHPKTRAFSEPVPWKAIGWTTSGVLPLPGGVASVNGEGPAPKSAETAHAEVASVNGAT